MKRAQAWYGDFVLGIIIFSIGLTIYYFYLSEYTTLQDNTFGSVVDQGELLSSQIIGSGTPPNWNHTNVLRIGLTNGDHIINAQKIAEFHQITYNESKEILGTIYDYGLHFQNSSGGYIGIEGQCSFGANWSTTVYSQAIAYYAGSENWLETTLQARHTVDIYKDSLPGSQFSDLQTVLTSYPLVILEHAALTYDVSIRNDLENYVDEGGILIITGSLYTADGHETTGVLFHTKAGQNPVDRNVTISQEVLNQPEGHHIELSHAAYVLNDSISGHGNFSVWANFSDDNEVAIASWPYGQGEVLYSSGSQALFAQGNFTDSLHRTSTTFLHLPCQTPSYTQSAQNIAKFERFVLYNGRMTKLVVVLQS